MEGARHDSSDGERFKSPSLLLGLSPYPRPRELNVTSSPQLGLKAASAAQIWQRACFKQGRSGFNNLQSQFQHRLAQLYFREVTHRPHALPACRKTQRMAVQKSVDLSVWWCVLDNPRSYSQYSCCRDDVVQVSRLYCWVKMSQVIPCSILIVSTI